MVDKKEPERKPSPPQPAAVNEQLKQRMMTDGKFVAGTLGGVRDLAEGRYYKATAFLADPFPSDGRTTSLDPPIPADIFGHQSGKFWFSFKVLNAEVIAITWAQFA